MPIDDQLEVGSILNQRFKILELIGAGGMSLVYKALDLRQQEMGESQPYIALKVLKSNLQQHSQLWTLLGQEAKKSQSLSHPNIVNVFDYDKTGDIAYMTMALLQGQSLEVRLKNKTLPSSLDDRLELALQIINAVIHAHEQGVVHADLKPSNIDIFIDSETKKSKAVIFDFGISRAVQASSPNLVAYSPAYATPLTIAGEPAGPYDDAYGLGCVLYMLISGEHPYRKVPANQIESPAQTLKPLKQLNFRQWSKLKQFLLFPFEPNYFGQKVFSAQAIHDPVATHKQVLDWLYALRDSLQVQRVLISAPQVAGVLITFCLFFSFVWWFTAPNTKGHDQVELLVQEHKYADAVDFLVEYKTDKGGIALSEETRNALIDGLVESISKLLDYREADYNPIQAKQVLDNALQVYPDSKALINLLNIYSDRVVQNQNKVVENLLSSINKSDFCLENCGVDGFFWGQQLKKYHPQQYALYENAFLQGIVKHYALLLYRDQGHQALVLRKKAEAFFSPEQLDQLGVLQEITTAEKQVQFKDSQDSLAVALAKVKAEIEQGKALFGQPDTSHQWQAVHDYMVAFQSLSLQASSPWRQSPFYSDEMKDYFADSDIPDWRRLAPDMPSLMKADPCFIEDKSSFACQDSYDTGKSPALISTYIDPQKGASYRLAVSRFELSWGDWKHYCKENNCKTKVGRSDQPVFHLSQDALDRYLDWLSGKTGYHYRVLTLEEWQYLADPLGLLKELVDDGSGIKAMTCRKMGYEVNKKSMESLIVYQGKYDRNGLYNLVDQAPEIVSSGTKFILVPGRRERLRRCRIEASAFEFPYATYRIARLVSDET
ncbi:MAG: bifunctional serine/threonine-protein kinase/formylglycine-generating enzyme family protein [Pseudomonadota bacterium]|nr:bifunctional serine/threonine-protein kinase/formylglycine-generating enzyme family protein [Pseudomonadota bacterium]